MLRVFSSLPKTTFGTQPARVPANALEINLCDVVNAMSCEDKSPSGPKPEKSAFEKLRDHAKEFVEASPEEHKK